MLIGAHVSTAGGLQNAVERGVERECDAIQIFHQSPRMWRPTNHKPENIATFNRSFEASRLGSTVIHAVYLINTATPDPEIREKSMTSLVHALRLGDAIGADGVVLHAGSRKQDPVDDAIERSGAVVREALAESESCPVLFENTAGTQGPLGRDFDELARLVESAGAGDRIGVCLDCCHLFASGYDIVADEDLGGVIDDFDAAVGLDRLQCLHVNDSRVPLGANRDMHANVGEGEMGPEGIATFLSEPRFEKLPALLETPGPDKKGSDVHEVRTAKELRERGLAAR
ncbi:MAG TPA: deoxyribonuclease IV [Solirubrobacterales bacterium]|nr:deoxyribonuclease IV [Solirubrobacterales bacterium]